MLKDRYIPLRENVQEIERKIFAITGSKEELNIAWSCSQRKCEQVERLVWKRRSLLNKMFLATTEEVARMEQVNNRLIGLTQKMYARAASLYRETMTGFYAPEFDDVEVKGLLKFSMNSHTPLLPLANDDYYGSDFYSILSVIDWLYICNYLKCEEIESCCSSINSADYRPEISDKVLGFADDLNDGSSWYSESQPAYNRLSHICICHAIHDLSDHKPYSIPDILRMNNFYCEVTVKHIYK